jgi:predicted nucleic acid-binding protein
MANPRIYLESSVVSYLANRPSGDVRTALRQLVTYQWWEQLDKSSVYVSDLVLIEIGKGHAEAAKRRLDFVKDLEIVDEPPETRALAARLMQEKLVPITEPEDATHIAIACLRQFDYLATWNFSHFVGFEPRYRVMTALEHWGLYPVKLVTPEELLERQKP